MEQNIWTRGELRITPNFTDIEYLNFKEQIFKAPHVWYPNTQNIIRNSASGSIYNLEYELHDIKYFCQLIESKGKSVNGKIYFSASWRDHQLIDFMYWDVINNEVIESNSEYNKCNVIEVFCVQFQKELNQLRKENKLLKREIKYMPDGKGAQEAKEHFESLQK